ncbi:PRA1 family protein [Sergentomyia squamirostris]
MNESLNFAPLRTLGDFVLSDASFGLPSVNDLEKWGNRVVKNLLYYQTNYFCLAGVLWLLLLLLNPKEFVQVALISVAALGGSKIIAMRHSDTFGSIQRILAIVAVVACLVLYMLELVVFLLLIFTLPFSAIFVHASLRLRNTKSKAVNTFQAAQLKKTPMGMFLASMNLVPDSAWIF